MNINIFFGSILVLLLFIAPAHSQSIKNAIPDVARPLPLSSVRVTGGPLKRAQDLNADYLLKLEAATVAFLQPGDPDEVHVWQTTERTPPRWFVDLGLMEGDIILALLEDLKRERGRKKPASSKV